MSILSKIILSVLVIVVGSLVAGIIKESVGHGQYIVSGIIGIVLFYIWGKSNPEKSIKSNGKSEVEDGLGPQDAKPQNSSSTAETSKQTSNESKVKADPNAPRMLTDNELYAVAWRELEVGKEDKGQWAKAYSECDGDKERTRANYIRLRVAQLQIRQRARLEDYKQKRLKHDLGVLHPKVEEIKSSYQWNSDRRYALLQKGYGEKNVNQRDVNGRTPLINAVKNGDEDAVILLLLLGATNDPISANGETAVKLARERNREDLAVLIENFHKLDWGSDWRTTDQGPLSSSKPSRYTRIQRRE